MVNTDEARASRFFEGLNVKIQKGVAKYTDFQDLYGRALEFERVLDKEDGANKRKFTNGNKNNGNKNNHNNHNKGPNNKSFQLANSSKLTVWKCRLLVKTTGGDLALARSSIDARRRVISLPSALQVFSLDMGVLVPWGDQPLLDLLFREVL